MKNILKKQITVLLSVCMVFACFSGCIGKHSGGPADGINRAAVDIPVTSDAEALTYYTASLSVESYIYARMKLEQFLAYDISAGSLDEYKAILNDTIRYFEIADGMSEALTEAVSKWMVTEASNGKKPAYTDLSTSKQPISPLSVLSLSVSAASDDSDSVRWAKDITEQFDKAPAGKGIRMLAEQMGTDAKHAYAALRQALDILDGATYEDIADTANKAYMTAQGLKTAGAVAGFVISIPASAPASALAAAVSTGGVVANGATALLEIGTLGSVIYTNGEGNYVSVACEQTQNQFAPIGQIISIAGVCQNIAGLKDTYTDIVKNGKTMFTYSETDDLANNTFGVLSYGWQTLNDYVSDGKILSGTFTKTPDGMKFTLMDTICGTEPEQKETVTKMLTEAGIPEDKVETAVNGTEPPELPKSAADAAPMEVIGNVLYGNPVDPAFDPVKYKEALQSAMTSANEADKTAAAEAEAGKQAEAETEETEETEEEPQPEVPALTIDTLIGSYSGTVTIKALRISDAAYQMFLEQEYADSEETPPSKAECDANLNSMLAEGSLKLTVSQSFELVCDDPASGLCAFYFTLVNDDSTGTAFVNSVIEGDHLLATCADGSSSVVTVTTDGGVTLSCDSLTTAVYDDEYGNDPLLFIDFAINAVK